MHSPVFYVDKERFGKAKHPSLGAPEAASKGWLRANLSSLALFGGNRLAAEALCLASCAPPDATIATTELADRPERQAVSMTLAAFEDFLLSQSIIDPSAPVAAKSSKSKKVAAEPTPAIPPKRRSLRV